MKVLVLTGKFGMGHVSAANAIKEELECELKGADVRVIDLVEYLFPRAGHIVYKAFDLLVNKCHGLYNVLNRIDEHDEIAPMNRWFVSKFKLLIEEHSPDLLVSTWPVGSKYIGAYKKKEGYEVPYITCITDISAHSEWLSDATTAYIVGDEASKREMEEKGVEPAKIFVGGIPVRQKFRTESLRKCGNKTKEVLIMGGGLGLIPGAEEMLDCMERMPGIHATVITGHNEKLRSRLSAKYKNADIMGYTENVDVYMKKADLIITKAGGITLFEAIHTETPMLIPQPFLEQEKNNAAYIESKGIGRIFNQNDLTADGEATQGLNEFLCEMLMHEQMLDSMRQNMREIKRDIESNSIVNVMKHVGIVA